MACSCLSPLLACHSLHTPHLTQFCTAIVYFTCLLLAAPFLLISYIRFTPPFVACFLLVTYPCFPLNTRLAYIFASILHPILWLFAELCHYSHDSFMWTSYGTRQLLHLSLCSHISGTLLRGCLPSSVTLHMPILCELFMAWGIFVPPLRQPRLWHSALWLFAFLCHSSHAYFMWILYGMGQLCAPN